MLAKLRSYRNYPEDFEVDLRECILLGQGHNGAVYLMPDGRAIKIFKERKHCTREYLILKKAEDSSHFPNAYECGDNYIVRDYVGGECLKDYLKDKSLSRRLGENLIELIEEFERLKFTKLDIRCRDLYVQEDEYLMAIDPKASFSRKVNFPRHLAKGLKKLRALEPFMDIVKDKRPENYEDWSLKLKRAGIL